MSALSVIIPAYNSANYLTLCLQALQLSTVSDYEVLVVDDGSTDESPQVAASFDAKLLSTGGRTGPAHARNLGAQAASSNLLLFIDSDVCVQPDTLANVLLVFEQNPDLTAVSGSYDDKPAHTGFISQYRNLMHAFFHQTGRREASTFWSGCGAIRKDVFLAEGGFSAYYGRPAIEDIELGYRLKKAGHKLLMDGGILVKHLKVWTFWKMINTDIFDRGIPWTELILRDKCMPDDLNLRVSQRTSVIIVFLMLLVASIGIFVHGVHLAVPMLALLIAVLNPYWIETSSVRPDRKLVIPLIVGIVTAGAIAAFHHRPAAALALLGIGYLLLSTRYLTLQADDRLRQLTGVLYGAYLVVLSFLLLSHIPLTEVSAGLVLLCVSVIALNWKFYLFLGRRWGKLYALAAIPFHVLYYLYSGFSFAAGLAKHLWNTRRTSPEKNPNSL